MGNKHVSVARSNSKVFDSYVNKGIRKIIKRVAFESRKSMEFQEVYKRHNFAQDGTAASFQNLSSRMDTGTKVNQTGSPTLIRLHR